MYGYLRFLYELTELPVCWLYPIRLTCYLILELYTIAALESLSQLFYGSGVDMSFWSIHSVGSHTHPASSLGHHHSHLRSLPSYLYEVNVFLAKNLEEVMVSTMRWHFLCPDAIWPIPKIEHTLPFTGVHIVGDTQTLTEGGTLELDDSWLDTETLWTQNHPYDDTAVANSITRLWHFHSSPQAEQLSAVWIP